MSKHRRKKGTGQKSVVLYEWELKLPAWQCLSPYAKLAVIELRRIYHPGNNAEIGLGVRDLATRIGCHKDTAAKALEDVQEKGWAVCTMPSSFNWKDSLARTWRITNQPVGLGVDQPATKEYVRWRPPEKQKPVLLDRTSRPTRPYVDTAKTVSHVRSDRTHIHLPGGWWRQRHAGFQA